MLQDGLKILRDLKNLMGIGFQMDLIMRYSMYDLEPCYIKSLFHIALKSQLILEHKLFCVTVFEKIWGCGGARLTVNLRFIAT